MPVDAVRTFNDLLGVHWSYRSVKGRTISNTPECDPALWRQARETVEPAQYISTALAWSDERRLSLQDSGRHGVLNAWQRWRVVREFPIVNGRAWCP